MARSKSKTGCEATGIDAAAKRACARPVWLRCRTNRCSRGVSMDRSNSGVPQQSDFTGSHQTRRSVTTPSLLQTKFPIEFAEMRSQLRNDGYWSGELRHFRKDGGEVIVDSRQQLLADGTVLEVNRDVTERKQIQRALHENEERLRWVASIVDFSDDAIVSKNLDGVITSWNRGAERVFGYTAEEAIGQPITIVIVRKTGMLKKKRTPDGFDEGSASTISRPFGNAKTEA